jgi:hypothetical protein
MIFIALVALAVWLADLPLTVALPLVALAWVIAAMIEYLAWRSARGPVAVVEGGAAAGPPAAPPVLPAEPEPAVPVEAEPNGEPPPVQQTVVQPPAPEPDPEPEAVVEPEPEPEPLLPPSEPAPTPVQEPEPVAADEPESEPEPESSRWGRRKRLRAVPAPPPDPIPAPEPEPETEQPRVVSLQQRSYAPRQWNLWELEKLARAEAQEHPERRDEWSFLFVHLREFATAEGELPAEFDSLVRESFGSLLERQPIR